MSCFFKIFRFMLSVTVNPPKKEALASSNAPVIVTPASNEASIAKFNISLSDI